MAVLLYQGNLHFQTGADETSERFTFRALSFCAEARFVYAGVYRRCP